MNVSPACGYRPCLLWKAGAVDEIGVISVSDDGERAFTSDSLYGMGKAYAYAGALSFMRRNYSRDLDGVDIVVSGIPLDTATTNRPGARFGPRARRSSDATATWPRPAECW